MSSPLAEVSHWSYASEQRNFWQDSVDELTRLNHMSERLFSQEAAHWSGPEVIKLFLCSTQISMKFVLLINLKLLTIANSFLLNITSMKISLLMNMKMPTFVGVFIFISRENFMLSWVEYKKRFITSEPGNYYNNQIAFSCWFTSYSNINSHDVAILMESASIMEWNRKSNFSMSYHYENMPI